MPINCFSLYLTYICTCLLLWYLRVLLILQVILWPICLWHLLSVNLSDPDAPKPEGNTMKPTDGGAAVVSGYSLHNTGNKHGQNWGVRWDLVTKCKCQNVNTHSPQHKKCSLNLACPRLPQPQNPKDLSQLHFRHWLVACGIQTGYRSMNRLYWSNWLETWVVIKMVWKSPETSRFCGITVASNDMTWLTIH